MSPTQCTGFVSPEGQYLRNVGGFPIDTQPHSYSCFTLTRAVIYFCCFLIL